MTAQRKRGEAAKLAEGAYCLTRTVAEISSMTGLSAEYLRAWGRRNGRTFARDKVGRKKKYERVSAAAIAKAREALIQARGALRLDHMVDENGEPYGTTTVALDEIDAALNLLGKE